MKSRKAPQKSSQACLTLSWESFRKAAGVWNRFGKEDDRGERLKYMPLRT